MRTQRKNGDHGIPPRRLCSRYMSLNPSHGAMAFREGGCCMAAQYWAIPSQELPAIPTLPLHQSKLAAASIRSWQSSPVVAWSTSFRQPPNTGCTTILSGHTPQTDLPFCQSNVDSPHCRKNLGHWGPGWRSLVGTTRSGRVCGRPQSASKLRARRGGELQSGLTPRTSLTRSGDSWVRRRDTEPRPSDWRHLHPCRTENRA